VFRRSMLLLPAVLGAMALSVTPALAGEDDNSGSATLHAPSHACVAGKRVKATVSGSDIDRVVFYVDGKRRKVVTRPAATGRFVFAMSCRRLSVGASQARAVVTFSGDTTDTLRFTITRLQQASPRFTG
jgi:hypothetical protein